MQFNGGVIIIMSERYEYSSFSELDIDSGNYFAIPESIILDTEMNEKRVTVFSFFSIFRGLNRSLFFSINNIVKWTGKQPNRNANGINNKIIQVIEQLINNGYLTLFEELNNSSSIKASFNLNKLSKECEHDRFAIIYLDEVDQIISYKNENSKDVYLNNDTLFLVFSYLRMKIYKRRNRLMPEEINCDNKNSHQYDINARRLRSPEAYNCYYSEIAEELNLSPRTVSKAVDVLNNLGLIYSEALPRIKYCDGKSERWRTDHTIFCNVYKREGNYLIASGKEYYSIEIENKKRKLNMLQ
jgi:DNA-binding transcriptional ArsR family regulator